MPSTWFNLIRRAARKPPHVVAHRLLSETRRLVDRHMLDPRQAWPSVEHLLSESSADSLDALWQRLARRPYVAAGGSQREALRRACPADEQQQILDAAQRALRHEVALLGSGSVSLGEAIRWNCDYKTGRCWPNRFAGDIDYANLDQPSDVKFPWELSRLQWLIPAGQAYLLTGDEQYAAGVRRLLDDWIDANPYGYSVNWACTMEAAIRIVSWTWFFHALHDSEAWRDAAFRAKFLSALYGHGRFTQQYLEYSDVNANHCTADAAGLVFAGLFFGGSDSRGPRAARRWHRAGWRLLERELLRQTTSDGVDFEGSTAYHRLCAELFFLPALYRERCGQSTPAAYRERVLAMADFTRAYTKPSGDAPLWGDADDARTLPLGQQAVNDHRYLPAMIAAAWREPPSAADLSELARGECLWTLGPSACEEAAAAEPAPQGSPRRSLAFAEGGYYVMRNEADHVFVDVAPVGMAGRGGHGHNDCLSFEAVLAGVPLITDSGAFVYTASCAARNRFRATGAHNTPAINQMEMNRFHGPTMLWTLQYDARPELRRWAPGEEADELVASHAGYLKLAKPVTPVRSFRLDHLRHELTIVDRFESAGDASYSLETPLHFHPAVQVQQVAPRGWLLEAGGESFRLNWEGDSLWQCSLQECRISPSYGVAIDSQRLLWCYAGQASLAELTVTIGPA